MTNSSEPENNSKQEKSDFEPEREAARKVFQGAAQVLIRWMPLGGSGFAFMSLLLKQEWFIAVLIFPLMILAVFWAAFTKGFLNRINEISEDVGQQGANRLAKFIEFSLEAIKWQLAGTDDKYLKCQGSSCSDYETIGYNQASGTFMPLLKDVFVPLELSDIFIKDFTGEELPGLPRFSRYQSDSEDLEITSRTLIIWDLLSQIRKNPALRRLAILAWGGFGKTTLLRHVTYSYMTKRYKRYKAPKLLPVLLYLRKWQDVLANNPPDLPTLIEQHHIPYLPEGKELKLSPSWAKNHLRLRRLDSKDPVTSNEFIDKIRDVSELIVKREEEYEFAHLSFQEFLAAKQIKETKQEQILLDNWQVQWWRGTILLYAALVNPRNFIRSLIAYNSEEATTLALRCLEETPRKVDPQLEAELTLLQSNVQNQLYQPLENYLQNGEWQEADRETWKVMLKVANREEQGWLDDDDIKNFPCEDLRTINQLWVKYSEGKFGFSVQKEIYESLGGDTKSHNQEVFDKFYDRVGWKEGGSWVSYGDYTFNLNAPDGHLPGLRGQEFTHTIQGGQVLYHVKQGSDNFIFLAQRLVACNI